ncbi:MAG: hypothetical protein H6832_03615 [Planctomycetes bacterium]|nr:hypothetical protein [Planctomycetota bacterium]
MRLLAALFLSLVTAIALFIAGFAALHGLGTPERETTSSIVAAVVPTPVATDIAPIDTNARRVDVGSVTDASHSRTTARLSGTVTIPGVARVLLLALSHNETVLAEAETDADGRFTFDALPVGSFELRVKSARGATLHVVPRLDLFADRSLVIDEPLSTTRTIEVLRGDEPVPKAFVILERRGGRRFTGTTNDAGRVEAPRLDSGDYEYRIWVYPVDARSDGDPGATGETNDTIVEIKGVTAIREADSVVRLSAR